MNSISRHDSPVAPPQNTQKGRRPDKIIKAVRDHTNARGETHSYWTTIGVAFLNSDGVSHSLKFNFYPTDPHVRIQLVLPSQDDLG